MFIFPEEPPQPSSPHNESVPSYCKNDEGDIFLAAESWKPDVCTSCVCMDSVISCYSESCPSVSCERPVLRKGQCCPYCIGKTNGKSLSSLPVAVKSTLAAIWLDQFMFVTCTRTPRGAWGGEWCELCARETQPVRNEGLSECRDVLAPSSPVGLLCFLDFQDGTLFLHPVLYSGPFVCAQTRAKCPEHRRLAAALRSTNSETRTSWPGYSSCLLPPPRSHFNHALSCPCRGPRDPTWGLRNRQSPLLLVTRGV